VITQLILDFLSRAVGNLLASLPPLPTQWGTALGWVGAGGTQLSSLLGKLGVILPWYAIEAVAAAWVGLLAFWFAMLIWRAVLWAFGR